MFAHQHLVILLAGPTASGKSKLALELAHQFNGIIINADSMQVYRDIPLLTASPSDQDKALIDHYLYNERNLDEPMSTAIWLNMALKGINESLAKGQLPIIVGGTGLYFKALESNLVYVPNIPKMLIDDLSQQAKIHGIVKLYHQLCDVDPNKAMLLKPHDTQRIIRALSVYLHTNRSLTWWQQQPPNNSKTNHLKFIKIYLNFDKSILHANVQQRLITMLDQGIINEVRTLLDKYERDVVETIKAVGIRQICDFLDNKMTLNDTLERILIATRQYNKRQRTWFRHQFSADHMINDIQDSSKEIFQFIAEQLNKKKR